jgi:hypothetical protein
LLAFVEKGGDEEIFAENLVLLRAEEVRLDRGNEGICFFLTGSHHICDSFILPKDLISDLSCNSHWARSNFEAGLDRLFEVHLR